MSMNLTTALVIVAVLVLAAIVLQAWWLTRKMLPKKHEAPAPVQRLGPDVDPLAAAVSERLGETVSAAPGDRIDPYFGELPATVAAIDRVLEAAPERAPGEDSADVVAGAQAAGLPAMAPHGPQPDHRLPVLTRRIAAIDPLIDAIATLTLDAPISGDMAAQHLPPSRRAGSKPMTIEGLSADSGEWESPRAGTRYGEFQAAVQMANRQGALNEIEFSEFVQKIQAFADGIGALADFPDMLDAVARGRELDHFASQHDAQLTAKLRANTVAWSVGYVQQCAARHGFVKGTTAGRLVLPGKGEVAMPVLTISFDPQAALAEDPAQAALRAITMTLDVAQTPEGEEPFAQWQEIARKLAEDLDASLVDDQGAPITLHAFAQISTELERLYRALEGHGLPAGSACAQRLFS